MSVKRRPQIGTNVWFVAEHYYYVPGRAAPELEYSVYQGKIRGYRMGRWTDASIEYQSEEGYIKLIDIAMNANTPKIFDNPRDAALLARDKTDAHMRRWGWVLELWPETPPMRRTWEKYLIYDNGTML